MVTEIFYTFFVLMVTLGIFALMMWGIKKSGLVPGTPKIKGKEKDLEFIESKTIDGRNRLVVVSWKGKQFLLGTNPNGIKVIGSHGGDTEAFKDFVDQASQVPGNNSENKE
ncbi:MAG: flagellar biosynthetic protein FliO [Kordiimonadaceae bacterium]|nr:flagellar biosynthetic protein FliO [Kordiimonadaceae bacterium]